MRVFRCQLKPARLTGKRKSNGEGSMAGDQQDGQKERGQQQNPGCTRIWRSFGFDLLKRSGRYLYAHLHTPDSHAQAYYVGIVGTSDKVVDISIIVYCELTCWYRIRAA
jgi:hypothetical protein